MHLVQIGITARGKSAQQVERAGGLEIAEFHSGRIGRAGVRGEVGAIDYVAAVAGQRHLALGFGVRRARLGELTGHPAHLYYWQRRPEGQNHRHLQQHAEGVADDVGGEVGEAFGTVTALQHESLAFGGKGQMRFQAACLSGEYQWWVPAQARFHLLKLRRVRVGRDLADRTIAPGIRVPRTLGRGAGRRRSGRHDGLLARSYVAKPPQRLLPREVPSVLPA